MARSLAGLVLGSILTVTFAGDAGAIVLCQQRGSRLVLRAETCLRKEVPVPLDADTLDGQTIDELLAPLEERIRALEALAVTTTTTTTTTSTTLPGPGLVTCRCADGIQSACVPQIRCSSYGEVGGACGGVVCLDHGGLTVGGELRCDNDDPACHE